jgi:type II secretory pathway component PulM
MRKLWQRLSRREKSLVLLAVSALVLVLGRYSLFDPFVERREWVKNQIELQPQHLAKNLRYLAQKKEIEADLEKSRGELKSLEPVLLAGDTPPVSASNLQEILQTSAAKDGVQVITTRVLSPESLGPFTRIPIQVEVSGQLEQVVNLIRGLEAAEKLLVINELNVRSLFTPAVPRPQAAGTPAAAQNLRASLILSGFVRAPAANPGDPSRAKSGNGKSPIKSAE